MPLCDETESSLEASFYEVSISGERVASNSFVEVFSREIVLFVKRGHSARIRSQRRPTGFLKVVVTVVNILTLI